MMRFCLIVYLLFILSGCAQSKKEALNAMSNPGTYFEIPVTDFERAVGFYEAVFLCELQIENIDGNQMAVFPVIPSHRASSERSPRAQATNPRWMARESIFTLRVSTKL